MPKYYAVKAHIALLVDELGEGAPIPTERDLSERFEVARETARQALRELVLEGRLRQQGRGTVVAGPSWSSRCPWPAIPRAYGVRGAPPAVRSSPWTVSPAPTRSPPRPA
ncbi:hypothetical protein GCM10010376_15350 [Streptomyces violaceusniger]